MEKIVFALLGIGMAFGTLAQEHKNAKAVEYNLAELLILATSSDQEPLTREELREESDVIVNGVIKSITPGREYYHEDDLPNSRPITTAIFEINVNYIEKGYEGETLYFEYIVSGIPVEILDAVKPDEQLELFLIKSSFNKAKYRIVDSDGRIKGFDHHIYYPTRDIALIDQIKGGRRYDIRDLLVEKGYATDIDQVDSDPTRREALEADAWDVNTEEPYFPEEVRESLDEQ